MKRDMIALVCRIVVATLMAGVCLAQNAEIVGRITDATGAVVPGAAVTVTNVGTGVQLPLRTNESGYYTATLLQPGNYRIGVEMQGFRQTTRSGIRLEVGQVARIDFVLTVGDLSEKVQVVGEAPLVASEEASLGTIVDRRKILELPLQGRDPLDLMTLAPGVLPNPRSPAAANINGGRDATTDILIDGAPTTKSDQGDSLMSPLLEGVEEFKVQTGSFGVEYGRSGGIVNVVTKSGTNQMHGSLFEFVRNDAFNANNFFFNATGQGKAKLIYNQFGGSLGGPVFLPKLYNGRNRTFFFFSPQYTRSRGAGLRQTTIPTALERAGDFRQSGTTGGAVPVFDPATTRASGATFVRDPFSGGVIPASRFDPIALNILKFGYPLPNNNNRANNFVSGGPTKSQNNAFLMRADHNFTPGNRLSVRFMRANNNSLKVESWPGFPAQSGSAAANNRGPDTALRENAVLRHTSTFRPTLLNEFSYSLMFSASTLNPASMNQGWAQKLGIKNAGPFLFPDVAISGYTGLYGGNLSVEGDVDHQVGDNVTWLRGAHSVKAGFEFRRLYYRKQAPGGASGTFSFNTLATRNPALTGNAAGGHGVASLLLGVPNSSGMSISDQKWGGFWHYWAAFLQDQWKLNPRLTLTYGVRWEYTRPRTERWNRQSVFDMSTLSLRFAGENGASEELFSTRIANFAPRVGLAWTPKGDNKTSVRAAFGLYYVPINPIGGANEFTRGFTAAKTFQTTDGGITFPMLLSQAFPVVTLSRDVGPTDTVSTIGPNYPLPYMNEWTLSLQREVFKKTLVEASYIGTKGTRLQVSSRNLNQVPVALLGPGNAQTRRPYPAFGNINYPYEPMADSIFHGMQIKMEHRFSSGLNLLGWYALQKSIDNSSGMKDIRNVGTVGIQDNYNLRAERSLSTFDRTHSAAVTGLYELPFGRGKKFATGGWPSALIGGWQINGILTMRTGLPLSISTSQNLTGSLGGGSRPNRLRSGRLDASQRSIQQWFDVAAFQTPPQFQFGNTSRTEPSLRGPGAKQFDFSLFRNVRIAEKLTVQVRGEAFNVLNRVNFGGPATSIGAAGAGIITSADDARSLQLGLRLFF
jgi:hypothetical protein